MIFQARFILLDFLFLVKFTVQTADTVNLTTEDVNMFGIENRTFANLSAVVPPFVQFDDSDLFSQLSQQNPSKVPFQQSTPDRSKLGNVSVAITAEEVLSPSSSSKY